MSSMHAPREVVGSPGCPGSVDSPCEGTGLPGIITPTVGVVKRYDNIVKSQQDKRQYRGLLLSNRLKVLLVSDPKTDKAATALDVNVGSLSDPDELPGLAHFCEHMLFLGTEKYPEENEYRKFLSEHGGNSNASTGADNTTYYFDVLPAHLDKALDIFAQFFIAPLFTESATGRELSAVNSEHEKNMSSDFWRLVQLNRSTSLPTHPFHKFGTGNKETLETIPKAKNINVRQELLKFHHQWYSSNIMTLVVLGKQSLDELESMVVPLFSVVEDKSVVADTWPDHPIPPELRRKKTYCVPITDGKSLIITFPIPDTRQYYKTAPGNYIGHLLGHEGPGSLLSAFKRRGWCNSLGTGGSINVRGFGFFSLQMDLTDEGLAHTDDIINLMFQYIAMLKSIDPQRWTWEEQRDILALEFRFMDAQEPIIMVDSHVHLLQDFPMEDILSIHYLMTEWKPEVITELLSLLTPENVRVMIFANAYEDKCTMTEPWYGTKYLQEDISESLIKEWSSVKVSEELHLPPPNEFIPTNLQLVKCDESSSDVIAPAIVKDTPRMRLWYKQDTEFLLPKAWMKFVMASPLVNADPLSYNLTSVWILLLRDSLQEFAYATQWAGIRWSIGYTNTINVSIEGYNDKQHVLLDKIMEHIVTFKADPKRFYIMKEVYRMSLKNSEAVEPCSLAIYQHALCLSDVAWTTYQLKEAAEDMTPEQLDDFASRMIRKVHIEALMFGNLTKERAVQIADSVENKLPKDGSPLLAQQLLLTREVEIEKGAWYVRETQTSIHRSSCASVYYTCGVRAPRQYVTLALLAHALTEPCFNTLRTKEQLGYIVFSGILQGNGVQGLRVVVQSNRHPEYLNQRIESFIQGFLEQLENMPEEEFLKHRLALAAQILDKPKQMSSRVSRIWSEIASQDYNFERPRVLVEQLNTITKEELIQFYKKHISQNSAERRKLSVYIVSTAEGGAGHEDTKNVEDEKESEKIQQKPMKITDLVEFKCRRSLYPHPEPFMYIPKKGAHCIL